MNLIAVTLAMVVTCLAHTNGADIRLFDEWSKVSTTCYNKQKTEETMQADVLKCAEACEDAKDNNNVLWCKTVEYNYATKRCILGDGADLRTGYTWKRTLKANVVAPHATLIEDDSGAKTILFDDWSYVSTICYNTQKTEETMRASLVNCKVSCEDAKDTNNSRWCKTVEYNEATKRCVLGDSADLRTGYFYKRTRKANPIVPAAGVINNASG